MYIPLTEFNFAVTDSLIRLRLLFDNFLSIDPHCMILYYSAIGSAFLKLSSYSSTAMCSVKRAQQSK